MSAASIAMQQHRSKPPKNERDPCAQCGWGPNRGIHLPIQSGPHAGKPWGHPHVPITPAPAPKAAP